MDYQGKWALITGASSGIGEAFAKELAQKGTNLVLVARRKEKLSAIADELMKQHQVQVDVIAMDLATPTSATELYSAVKKLDRHIDILVNNAGFGIFGKLHQTSLSKNQELMMLNIVTLTNLTHLFIQDMLQKKEGAIINLASTAAFQPTPYVSTYGASKAYVLSFTEALWAEYRTLGIKVLAVCPGPSDTEFFKVLGANLDAFSKILKMVPARDVVQTALRSLESNKIYVVTGSWVNYLMSNSVRFTPRALVAKFGELFLRPKNGM